MQEVYQTQSTMNQVDVERFQEKVEITSAYLDSTGQLVLNITNQGSVTANLLRLWVINQTDNEFFSYDFSNLYVLPGASVSNISNVGFASGKNYAIRVTTERGNIASYNLVPAVQARIGIMASSSNLIGNNVTVILCITNNDTSGNNIYNLEPLLNVSPEPSLELVEGPFPAQISLLPPGSSAYFMYVYKVTGSGFTINLNGTFTNAPQGNYVTSKIYATTVDVTREVTTMPVFHLDAFGSIPALLDSSSGVWTYWGVALANPYDRTIKVYSVGVIATTSPLYSPGTLEGIQPATGWSASSTSIYSGVFWQYSGAPIEIPARSAVSFTFRIRVSSPSGGIIETPINVEAITTEGKFVKSFTTSSHGTYPAMNVYLTNTPSTPTVSKEYVITGIQRSSTQTFNIVIYNSGKNSLTSKVNLLIRVPVGWTNVVNLYEAGWDYSSQNTNITKEPDGSWLITVESAASLLASESSLVYKFSATMPAVDSTTLYTLAITAYYPQFSPSITAAYCGAVVQVVPG